jgi:4-aminobutyrate aminotransferase/(S)-3-amino-2-methylpropionate transaminase
MPFPTTSLTPVPTERIETSWRRIVTPIPVPESLPVIEQLRRLEPRSLSGMPPILWDRATGFVVQDPYGNQWIDLTSGIVMANAGHGHPQISSAIREMCVRPLMGTYIFPQQARLPLLDKLVQLSPIPDSKAILFSAGTEATECAMMLMRRHGRQIHPDKVGILSFGDGYHGRTLAAALATGTPGPHDWIDRERVCHYQIPFPFGPRWPWGDVADDPTGEQAFAQSIEELSQRGITPDKIAGFIGESVPGWATWPIPRGYAAALMAWAREHNILVCFDEVQCGCGRTGRMWGMEHFGVVPDLFTLGKGLSSSLPVSAVVGRSDILDDPEAGDMSSTHGGNPVCAAAALACLQVLEEEQLVAAAASTGQLVLNSLNELADEFPDRILSIHGPGLFIGVHIRRPDTGESDAQLADAIVLESMRRGVLMFVTGRGFLKFTPPLGIEPEAALEAAEVIKACFRECVAALSA